MRHDEAGQGRSCPYQDAGSSRAATWGQVLTPWPRHAASALPPGKGRLCSHSAQHAPWGSRASLQFIFSVWPFKQTAAAASDEARDANEYVQRGLSQGPVRPSLCGRSVLIDAILGHVYGTAGKCAQWFLAHVARSSITGCSHLNLDRATGRRRVSVEFRMHCIAFVTISVATLGLGRGRLLYWAARGVCEDGEVQVSSPDDTSEQTITVQGGWSTSSNTDEPLAAREKSLSE